MRLDAIDCKSFKSGNSFLTKAEKAKTISDKNYWTSLHYEAMSRLNNIKCKNTRSLLSAVQDTGSVCGGFVMLLIFAKMGYERLKSDVFGYKAYSTFTNRFAEPDDFCSREPRHYKIKENYL